MINPLLGSAYLLSFYHNYCTFRSSVEDYLFLFALSQKGAVSPTQGKLSFPNAGKPLHWQSPGTRIQPLLLPAKHSSTFALSDHSTDKWSWLNCHCTQEFHCNPKGFIARVTEISHLHRELEGQERVLAEHWIGTPQLSCFLKTPTCVPRSGCSSLQAACLLLSPQVLSQ